MTATAIIIVAMSRMTTILTMRIIPRIIRIIIFVITKKRNVNLKKKLFRISLNTGEAKVTLKIQL